MKTYDEYKEYLNSLGYYEKNIEYPYEVINGTYNSVTFGNLETQKMIVLGLQPDDDFEAELQSLNNGDVIENNNLSRYEVIGAFIPGPVCNIAGFTDFNRSGITLKGKKNRYSLIDSLDSDDSISSYYTDRMDLFEKCIWIQNHVVEHEEFILQCHLNNLKLIRTKFEPILNKYDFYQSYSSIFDCSGEMELDSSNLCISFLPKARNFSIDRLWIETDCITGELLIQNKPLKRDFEDYLLHEFMWDGDDYHMIFRYLFYDDWTMNSPLEIFNLRELVIKGTENIEFRKTAVEEFEKTINVKDIPTQYQHLINTINSWKNNG